MAPYPYPSAFIPRKAGRPAAPRVQDQDDRGYKCLVQHIRLVMVDDVRFSAILLTKVYVSPLGVHRVLLARFPKAQGTIRICKTLPRLVYQAFRLSIFCALRR